MTLSILILERTPHTFDGLRVDGLVFGIDEIIAMIHPIEDVIRMISQLAVGGPTVADDMSTWEQN